MDIFRQAGEALSKLRQQAGRQAEILGLQSRLGGLESDLERVYVEAGKRAEELVQARQVHDEELKVILRRAVDLREQMLQVRREIQKLQNETGAVETSEPPVKTAAPTAPPSQSIPQPTPASVGAVRCAQCGNPAPRGETFCPYCGVKLPRQGG